MAKKVVAKGKKKDSKGLAKIIRAVRSKKTKAYIFKEDIVPIEDIKQHLST